MECDLFFQAEDGIRDYKVTGVQTCALPICLRAAMSFALLFSGQGTQHPAMLPWLADDAWTQAVCEQLQVAHWRDRLADAPWAESNAVAQPLLAGLAIAAWVQLSPQLPAPSALAGFNGGGLAPIRGAGAAGGRRSG